MKDVIDFLKSQAPDPSQGLPYEIFLYASSIIPMVNVDVLIQDTKLNKTLLSWRNDIHSGVGWHIPGGMLRFKETLFYRVQKVVETEIFSEVKLINTPIEINEIVRPKDINIRGHFISFLYKGFLDSTLPLKNDDKKETDVGYLKWFDKCPDNLLPVHEIYRKHFL